MKKLLGKGGKPKAIACFLESESPRILDFPNGHITVSDLHLRIQQEFGSQQKPSLYHLYMHGSLQEISQPELDKHRFLIVHLVPVEKETVVEGQPLPPGPPPRPIIGNALDLVDSALGAVRLVEKYGPVFKFVSPAFGPSMFLSDPKLAEQIFTQPELFAKLHMKRIRTRRAFPTGLFTDDDDEESWGIGHRILLPAFSLTGMKSYFHIVKECTTELIEAVRSLAEKGEVFDPMHVFACFTLDVIGRVAMGLKFNAVKSGKHPFLDMVERSFKERDKMQASPLKNMLMPKVARKKVEKTSDEMHKYLLDLLQEKRKELQQGVKSNDLLTLMLTTEDPKTKQKMSDATIAGQLVTFLIAGHDSTSSSLSTLFTEIAQDAVVEGNVLHELQEKFGGQDLTWEDMSRMPYGTQTIKENLRMHPPAAFVVKSATQDTKVGPFGAPKGSFIMLSVWGLHYNATAWPNPYKFDPERFSPQASEGRNPHAWVPFSTGPRACIGMQLSLLEQKVALVSLLREFVFRLDPSSNMSYTNPLFIKYRGLRLRAFSRDRKASATGVKPAEIPPIVEKPTVRTVQSGAGQANGKQLVVAYGSNTGGCMDYANQLATEGEGYGFAVKIGCLDDLALGKLPRPSEEEGALVIISSTYNGLPPDNAERFRDWVGGGKKPAEQSAVAYFKNTHYSVFGCGNTQWKTYQMFPSLVDNRLELLGAQRFHELGKGDADASLDNDFLTWKQNMWLLLHELLGISGSLTAPDVQFPVIEVGAPLGTAGHDHEAVKKLLDEKSGLVLAKVSVNEELQNVAHTQRSTRHIELELPKGVTYRAGDHLGVCPQNHPSVVGLAAKLLGVDLASIICVKKGPYPKSFMFPTEVDVSVEFYLQWFVDLQSVATRAQLQLLAGRATKAEEQAKLQAFASESNQLFEEHVFKPKRSVLEILTEFPSIKRLSLGEFMGMMPSLKLRYYSISSSPLVLPNAVSITVGVVNTVTPGGRHHFGACSDFLGRLGPGHHLRVHVKDTKSSFRLPADANTPIILIGPGTGFAPMRGFLQERHARAAAAKNKDCGENLVLFGCRSEDDWIYRKEMTEYSAKNSPTTLHVAFSRKSGAEKHYVQDVLREEGEHVWRLISNGGHIYVCGDAKYMAKDVEKTLGLIVSKHGGMNEAMAKEFLNHLSFDKRYCQDVWASSN